MSETVNWEKAYRDQTERVVELRRENAALRADQETLDWLEANAISIKVPHGSGRFAIILPTRETIQQARKEAQP